MRRDINGTAVSASQHYTLACGRKRVFHSSFFFHRGLWGPWVICIHTQGRNQINSVHTHKIFFLAQKLVSNCVASGPYGTDIHFSKYGRHLRVKIMKKKRTVNKKIFDYELKNGLFRYSIRSLEDPIKENVTFSKTILYIYF